MTLPDVQHVASKVVVFVLKERVLPQHLPGQHLNHERTQKVRVQYRKTNSEIQEWNFKNVRHSKCRCSYNIYVNLSS